VAPVDGQGEARHEDGHAEGHDDERLSIISSATRASHRRASMRDVDVSTFEPLGDNRLPAIAETAVQGQLTLIRTMTPAGAGLLAGMPALGQGRNVALGAS